MRELNDGPSANDGGMDVDEFLTWAAYFSIEPPVEMRVDAQTGLLMAQAYNMNRGKGKPARGPKDFMPQWTRAERPEMTLAELGAAMRRQYVALGGDPTKLADFRGQAD